MNFYDTVLHDLLKFALFPIILLLFSLILLLLVTLGKSLLYRFKLDKKIDIYALRLYLVCLASILTITLVYWIVDTHYINIPDPVLPYTLIILIVTVLFSARTSIMTAIFSFFLFDYFLFEPRYQIYNSQDAISIFYAIIGLLITFYIGFRIRKYQHNLLQKTGDLEMLIKARDQFAAVTAHDLKNPISTIKLYTELLNKQSGKKAGKILTQSTSIIEKETDKLLAMINLLLDFSKLQRGKLKIKKMKFNLYLLCNERIKVMQTNYPSHNFEIESGLKSAPVYADRLSLDRVITNLLSNAAKYSAPDSTIILRLKKERKSYILKVEDNGKGISKEDQKNLFEPFYQSKESKQGLGLGLYIVKAIIELHKGSVAVKSQLGKGTSFILTLPSSANKSV
jgi:signal transduction histidine kinase